MQQLTGDQKEKLAKAESLIADVQVELLRASEAANEPRPEQNWRDLYWLRLKLVQFSHNSFLATRL